MTGRELQNKTPGKVIWLHIGANKTGTTAFQVYCAQHQQALLEAGVLYPATGRSGEAHHRLGWAFNPIGPTEPTEDLYDALFAEIAASPAQDILISSEVFFIGTDVEALAQALKGHDVRIIVFLRRQDEWYEMMYTQFVKQPEFRVGSPIGETAALRIVEPCLDYEAWIGRWADAFGDKQMVCRPYGSGVAGHSDSIAAMFELIGKPELAAFSRPTDPGSINRSIFGPEFDAVRLTNGLALLRDDRGRLLYHFQRAVKRLKTKKREDGLMEPAQRDAMKDRYRQGNVRLFARLGVTIADGLFGDRQKKAEAPTDEPPLPAISAVTEIMSILWVEQRYDSSFATAIDPTTANALLAQCQNDAFAGEHVTLVITAVPDKTAIAALSAYVNLVSRFLGHRQVSVGAFVGTPELEGALRSTVTEITPVRGRDAVERHLDAASKASGPVVAIDFGLLPTFAWSDVAMKLGKACPIVLLDDEQRGGAIAFMSGQDYRKTMQKAYVKAAPTSQEICKVARSITRSGVGTIASEALIDIISPINEKRATNFQREMHEMFAEICAGNRTET